METKNWLSKMPGNPHLINMVIPGSHDAGVYGESLSTRKAPKAFARCQGANIYNQALRGSRMFDCRVFLKREASSGKIVPTMGHFGMEKKKHSHGSRGTLGAYGGTLVTAVNDALAFVKTYDTEFLILRFSHTYCPEEVGAALNEIRETRDNANYIYRKEQNVALEQLSSLKGKVIMIFASEFHKDFKAIDGYLPFYNYKDGAAPPYEIPKGLACCGNYTATRMMSRVKGAADAASDNHQGHFNTHLHYVYWQQTMPLGVGNIKRVTKGGAHKKMDAYIAGLREKKNQDAQYRLPNVISHDFVTEETCSQIIRLNSGYPEV